MKLSRHALTVLTRQYKSVLLKCALINAGLFLAVAPAMATVIATTGGTDSTNADFKSQPLVNVTGLSISDTNGLQNALNAKLDSTTASTTYATQVALSAKQDTISDLETIRSGAQAGATALQDFSTMTASDVNTALGYTAADAADVTALDTRVTTAEGQITDLTTNTSTGAINVASANIGATGLTSDGDIKTTGSGNIVSAGNISTVNGTISGKEGSFTGNLGVTGTTTTGALSVTNNATIGGTLSAGATTVNGTFGAGTGGAMFVVDADGDITKAGTIAATGITTTANSTALGGSGFNNTITGSKTTINGLTQLDAANGMKFGDGGQVVTSVDTAGIAQGGTGTTAALASTQSVVNTIKNQAQDATFTPAAGAFNVASATTINGAITALDEAVGSLADWTKDDTNNPLTVGTALAPNSSLADAVSQLNVNIGSNVTTTTNGVAATNTVNANIDALNTAMGDVSTLDVNSVTTPATVVDAINKIDSNMETVLGGIYKADGAYDQDAIKGTNGFDDKATSDNLTAALKSYADNVVDATGVAYNADGTVATTYTKASSVDYDGLNANSSLKAAIEQLDGNIGTAITGTTRTATGATTAAASTVNANIAAIDAYLGGDVTVTARTTGALVASNTVKANLEALDAAIGTDADLLTTTVSTATGDNNGVKVGNSVNRNIAALNAAVGDVATLSIGTGATGDAITNGTGTAAPTIVTALNNIDATIGNIHDLYDGTTVYSTVPSTVNGHSNLAVGTSTTVEDHLVSLDNSIGDRSFATTKYIAPNDDLATAATKLDEKLYSLDHEVKKMHHDMDRGLASVAALSALIPNARGTGNTTLSVGTGYYNGHSAMAFGGAHWFTDNLMVNIGAATSMGHTRNATYRAGISYSF